MRGRALALATALALALGCASSEGSAADDAPVLSFPMALIRLAAGTDTVEMVVELASTVEQQSLGLMERRHLADTAGMLFLYPDDQPPSAGFWMFRTRIPLDIAFTDSLGIIRAIRQMAPCPARLAAGCPSYEPGVPYRAALEVNAGYFTTHGVGMGSRVLLGDTIRVVKGR